MNSEQRQTIRFGTHWQPIILWAVLIAFFAWVAWYLSTIPSSGVDYYYSFYPAVQAWLSGKTQLYDAAAAPYGYYHPPWTLWLFTVFAIMPYSLGLALLRVASLIALCASIFVFTQPGHARPIALALGLINLITFDLINRGQIDAASVLGSALCWVAVHNKRLWLLSAGYGVLMFTPPNTIPVALFFLWLSWKHWPVQDLIKSLLLPVVMLAFSLVIFPGWYIRWGSYYSLNTPPGYWFTTLWRAQEVLGLPKIVLWVVVGAIICITVWAWYRIVRSLHRPEKERSLGQLMLVIASTTLISPYVTTYRLLLLSAILLPVLVNWRLVAGLLLYACTFTPLLRLWAGYQNSWLDVILMIVAFILAVGFVITEFKPEFFQPNLKESS